MTTYSYTIYDKNGVVLQDGLNMKEALNWIKTTNGRWDSSLACFPNAAAWVIANGTFIRREK